MPVHLKTVVPWGRSFDEYVRMFALSSTDLERRILGCGDGPAAFNAAMHRKEKTVVSVDPLYQFTAEQIRSRVQEVSRTILEQLLVSQSAYVWTTPSSPEAVIRVRLQAMEDFLKDFEPGRSEGRYLPHELPDLPFADGQFDLALCSHLLFTYSGPLSVEFHLRALREMCRVAGEVRVFPLLDQGGQSSAHLEPVCNQLQREGFHIVFVPVDYEFQRGGNRMMQARRITI